MAAEGKPHGVAGMQEMDVDVGDGIIAVYLIGLSDRVNGLACLHDVDVVFAPVHHLSLVAYFDRCCAWGLRF